MTKFIYKPKGKAQEYSPWACNLYNGCSNQCSYCYNRNSQAKALLGADTVSPRKSNGKPLSEDESFEIFKKELDRYLDEIITDGGLHFSFVSDPCLPETYKLNLRCIEYAIIQGVNVQLLTKCAEWPFYPEWDRFLCFFSRACPDLHENLSIGFTLTGCDELEGNAPSNDKRIDTMALIHNNYGLKTWASIEPVIDLDRAFDVIRRASKYCDHFKIGLLSGKKDYTPEDVRVFMYRVESELKDKSFLWKRSVLEFIEKD